MHFDESDSEPLKQWIVKKLEDISDADSDVLADYVLALVKTDDPELVAKAKIVSELHDFLGDNSVSFVNDAFQAIATRSYDPSRPPPPPPKPTASVYEPPRRAGFEPPRHPNESKKRSYQDWDAGGQQNGRIQGYESGDRPMKQPRRGGGRAYEQRGGRVSQQPMQSFGAPAPSAQQAQQLQLPPMPTPPPGMPPFDPNNPQAAMAMMMAMQQVMGMPPLPGMPSAGSPTQLNGFGAQQRTGQRCRDYDTMGFCARGVSCPYEHGDNPYIVPQQSDDYDPNNASIFPTPTRTGSLDTSPNDRGRGGARGRGRAVHRGGGKRAEFSHIGKNHDRSVTSIVVEQIPEDHFDEQSVRDFFGEFGNIEEVTMQPYKRLAIVKFESYDGARAAYDSPKSVFDNRFVKVYWYKPETLPRPTNGHASSSPAKARDSMDIEMKQDEPDFDPEEVARRQAEAQRKHDEAKKQREESSKQRLELEEKLRATEQERKKMADILAKKTGGKTVTDGVAGEEESEQTKQLKAQLAKLEAEAKSMGIDPDAPATNGYYGSPTTSYPPTGYQGRGRGGYRGRTPRGRGFHQPSYRGGWAGAARVKPTMSLDNRPKTVAVTFLDSRYAEREEALRQYLTFNALESAVLSKHPGREDAALVVFQQRFEGENFMAAAEGVGPLGSSELVKHLGGIEMAWHSSTAGEKPAAAAAMNGSHGGEDVKMHTGEGEEGQAGKTEPSRDLDTYEEDHDDMDRWG